MIGSESADDNERRQSFLKMAIEWHEGEKTDENPCFKRKSQDLLVCETAVSASIRMT